MYTYVCMYTYISYLKKVEVVYMIVFKSMVYMYARVLNIKIFSDRKTDYRTVSVFSLKKIKGVKFTQVASTRHFDVSN